jgi:hypothetical protein
MAANAVGLGGDGDPGAAGTFVDRALAAHAGMVGTTAPPGAKDPT